MFEKILYGTLPEQKVRQNGQQGAGGVGGVGGRWRGLAGAMLSTSLIIWPQKPNEELQD